MSRSPEVDAFLAKQRQPFRSVLEDLRSAIHEAAPGAGERVAYGIPVITLNGKNLVGFNAARDHCTFQLMSITPIERHSAELAGYQTGKGSVQFSPDAPLPRDLVTRLVRERIEENAERAGSRSR